MIEVSLGHLVVRSSIGALTFGRSSRCVLKLDGYRDDDRLSRCTGAFQGKDTQWQLTNTSNQLDLVVDIDGSSHSVLKPGGYPLTLPPGCVGHVVIQTVKEHVLHFTLSDDAATGSCGLLPGMSFEEETTRDMVSAFELKDDELVMLIALCEPRLRNPAASPWAIPSVGAICARLGLTPKQAEKRLDQLALKFSIAVDDLMGDNNGRAVMRRYLIADFALRTRCVTSSGLRRLPPNSPAASPPEGKGSIP